MGIWMIFTDLSPQYGLKYDKIIISLFEDYNRPEHVQGVCVTLV